MHDHPTHDNGGPPDESPFEHLISSLVTMYLITRDMNPGPDGTVVTVHAEHDDEHDIFLLKIGIGNAANSIMTAEHDAARAAQGGGA